MRTQADAPGAGAGAALEAREITAGYGHKPVLHGVGLRLTAGEFVGLIGPNGAGKSTLLRVLSGTLAPQSGTVLLGSEPVGRMRPRDIARRLAFVPQTEATLFEFSVRDVVLMGRHPHSRGLGGETEQDYRAAIRAMSATDTLQLAERPVTELSGGEHRRVLLARALAQEAPILLLDEPTAHLDIGHQAEILALARRLADQDGRAMLAALHDLNLASEYCDRLLLLADGRVAAEGPPDAVLTQDALQRAYGDRVHVGASPVSGRPFVFTTADAASEAGGAHALRVHVVCGGGSGLAILSALHRRGWCITAGALNRLDSDETATATLGIEHAVEAPFSAIGPEARARAAGLTARADAIVITDAPFGPGNLANLELAAEAGESGKPVFVLGDGDYAARDFAGGEAARLFEQLARGGAERVGGLPALEQALDRLARERMGAEGEAVGGPLRPT